MRADSPHKTAKDLVQAIQRSADREFKASGSAQGGVNHLAMAGMMTAAGIPVTRVAWVPSEGAAPGLQDLVASGIQFATASLPEGKTFIDAGRIKPLAIFAASRDPADARCPDLQGGNRVRLGDRLLAWLGGAEGNAPEIVGKLQQAVGKVVEHPEYLKFMQAKGYATGWTPGEGFRKYMAENDKNLGQMMRVVGIVK